MTGIILLVAMTKMLLMMALITIHMMRSMAHCDVKLMYAVKDDAASMTTFPYEKSLHAYTS